MIVSPINPFCPIRRGGRNKLVVGLPCGPPTAVLKVGPFGLKGNDDRRTESVEGLPLGFDSCQRFMPSPTVASSVFATGSTTPLFADNWF